jgi:hypothetical protein
MIILANNHLKALNWLFNHKIIYNINFQIYKTIRLLISDFEVLGKYYTEKIFINWNLEEYGYFPKDRN